ncbi:Aldo keto reductase [Pyrrhoderma noxium]|uniref:Aldo keto reductase n=1 Tax=Pyrrhoderma noxium TaxID=2282107 RepID=A0A286U6M3_9AGAM|nr:Aldo keto reductase [Pyrrhoderma noxium]
MSSTSTQLAPVRNTTMPYVNLGSSGLRISRIILGCMSYGSKRWQEWNLEGDEAMEHVKHAYDAGIQTFDTANTYSNGLSEVLLGKAIKKYNLPRDEIVVMTKCYFTVRRNPEDQMYMDPTLPEKNGYVNQFGLSRKHIFDSVKRSLERLQLDYIDVLQCHRFDYNTPIAETMQALHDVVKAGYVRYIGMSSCFAWQFCLMQNYAISHNLTPFISMQNHYNIVYRQEEVEMMSALKHYGVSSIPWSPLARGLVCRPQSEKTVRSQTDFWENPYTSEANPEIIRRIEEVAKKRGFSMAQVSFLWVSNKNPVAAPIIGATKLKNLDELIAVVNEKLTEEEMKYLEEPYKQIPTLGHW